MLEGAGGERRRQLKGQRRGGGAKAGNRRVEGGLILCRTGAGPIHILTEARGREGAQESDKLGLSLASLT